MLRRAYEEAVAPKAMPSKRRYVAEIRRLEDQAVAAGDLEAAVLLRDKRLPVEAALARWDLETWEERELKPVVLEPQAAERRGGLVLRDGHLTSWRAGNGEAVWGIRVQPGRYLVELTFSCAAKPLDGGALLPGGAITFAEDTALVENQIGFEVLPFETWDTYCSFLIGEMEFKAANTGVKIRSDRVRGEHLMRLKQVRLIPVRPPAPAETKPDLPSVGQLQASFESLLLRRTASLDRDYLRGLKALEEKAETADLKMRLRAEIDTVTERLASTQVAE